MKINHFMTITLALLLSLFLCSANAATLNCSKSFKVKAGPIWNNRDAQGKCPRVCAHHHARWNGQWTTIVGQRI